VPESEKQAVRVFEKVALPVVVARRHQRIFVGFDDDDDLLGRHAGSSARTAT
jgi:hypothetical protein